MLARHYDSMGRTTSMYNHSVGPTRRPRVHRQPNQPTPLNHQDPCTTRPPTHRHLGVHHFGSALPTQRAENGASWSRASLRHLRLGLRTVVWRGWQVIRPVSIALSNHRTVHWPTDRTYSGASMRSLD